MDKRDKNISLKWTFIILVLIFHRKTIKRKCMVYQQKNLWIDLFVSESIIHC